MRLLEGRVVATTRAGRRDDALARRLEREGARVVAWRTHAIVRGTEADLSAAAQALSSYQWIVLTSAHGAAALTRVVPEPLPDVRVAAVGPGTAAALEAAGWAVGLAGSGGAVELAEAMADSSALKGARVLFPAGSLARPTLEDELRARGADVHRVEAYRTVPDPPDAATVRADLARGVDVVAFASPSAVSSLAESLSADWPRALAGCGVVAIGATTARALRRSGVDRVRTAASPTFDGLVDVCAEEAMHRAPARPPAGTRP